MSFYYDHEKEAQERRIDYDLSAADNYAMATRNGFQLEDVAYVLASVMGENDGPAYWWLIAMKDHTYAVVTGGCDYTGWDCQASSEANIFATLKEAIAFLPDKESYHGSRKIRESVLLQLHGELAVGEVKE